MIVRFTLPLLLFALLSILCGCLYRSEGIFKRIGDSDYKARLNFQNLAAVGDGGLTAVEIESQHYSGSKEIIVSPNRVNSHDIFVEKR